MHPALRRFLGVDSCPPVWWLSPSVSVSVSVGAPARRMWWPGPSDDVPHLSPDPLVADPLSGGCDPLVAVSSLNWVSVGRFLRSAGDTRPVDVTAGPLDDTLGGPHLPLIDGCREKARMQWSSTASVPFACIRGISTPFPCICDGVTDSFPASVEVTRPLPCIRDGYPDHPSCPQQEPPLRGPGKLSTEW